MVAIPDALKEAMAKYPEVNWSAVARCGFITYISKRNKK